MAKHHSAEVQQRIIEAREHHKTREDRQLDAWERQHESDVKRVIGGRKPVLTDAQRKAIGVEGQVS